MSFRAAYIKSTHNKINDPKTERLRASFKRINNVRKTTWTVRVWCIPIKQASSYDLTKSERALMILYNVRLNKAITIARIGSIDISYSVVSNEPLTNSTEFKHWSIIEIITCQSNFDRKFLL